MTACAGGHVVAAFVLSALTVAVACDPADRPGLSTGAGGCTAVNTGKPDAGTFQCSDDPWSCEPGTTCWVEEKTGNKYGCLPSVSGARAGAACESVIGTAHCDDGYLCFTTTVSAPGRCVPFCDPCGHPCEAGMTCTPVQLVGGATVVHGCIPTVADGG